MPHTGVNKDKDGNRMAKCKTPPTTPGEQIVQQILNNYDIKSAEDVQDVLKQIFGPIFESMLKGEMENHLGHKKHERPKTVTMSERLFIQDAQDLSGRGSYPRP